MPCIKTVQSTLLIYVVYCLYINCNLQLASSCQPGVCWAVTSILNMCMFSKSKFILILAGIKYNWRIRIAASFKTTHSVIGSCLLSTYYCPGTYHGARQGVFKSETKETLCPHGAYSSESDVNDKSIKRLHRSFRTWSIFSLKFIVITMYRVQTTPTKAYTWLLLNFISDCWKHLPHPMWLRKK